MDGDVSAASELVSVSSSAQGIIRISLCQTVSCPGNVKSNLQNIKRHLQECSASSDIVVFPELFLTGYSIGKKRMMDVSMTRNDKALKYVAGMAMRFKCSVVVSFPERPDFRTDIMFISAIVFDSTGSEVCFYRKRHLWGAYEESMFSAGDYEPPAFYLSPHLNVKLGIAICYDLEFCDISDALSRNGVQVLNYCTPKFSDAMFMRLCCTDYPLLEVFPFVAQVLVFVSACSVSDMSKIQRIAQKRAIEHNMFVCYANHSSSMGEWTKRWAQFSGGSFIVSPSGELAACARRLPEILTHVFVVV